MSKFLDEKGLRQLIELIRNLNSEGDSEGMRLSAGEGIEIDSDNKINVKFDGTTIKLNDDDKLEIVNLLPNITLADAGKVLMVNSEGNLELAEVNLPKEPTNVIRMQQDGVDPFSGQRIVHAYRWGDTTNPLSYDDIVAIKNENLNLPVIMKDPDEVYESGHDIVDMILLSAEYSYGYNHYRVLFYSGLIPSNVELQAGNRSDPMRVHFNS